jgi:hypothetical protein
MVLRAKGNAILESLPAKEFGKISRELELVPLQKDVSVVPPGRRSDYLYFPTEAVISFLAEIPGAAGSMEIFSVGSEGVAGISGIIGRSSPFPGVVQVPGAALRGKASALRHYFERSEAFRSSVLTYLDYLLVHVSYLGFCNNSHPLVQRLSRWLLIMEERAGSNILHFTQDSIAGVLGTRRATISVAAAELQAAGAIRYTPGTIVVQSRRKLRQAACGCYKMIA